MNDILIGGIIGVIGTLSGVVLVEIVKRLGKVRITTKNIKANFLKVSMSAVVDDIIGKNGANKLECNFDVQVYNGKDIPMMCDDIKLIFKHNNIKVRECNIKDRETRKDEFCITRYDNISNIELNPKSLKEIKMKVDINNDVVKLKNCKMYLRYCDITTNKIKECLILDLEDLD